MPTTHRAFDLKPDTDLMRAGQRGTTKRHRTLRRSVGLSIMKEPRLLALTTAEPSHTLRQSDARAEAAKIFGRDPETDRLMAVFSNAQIETRHSCIPVEWYEQSRGWVERNALYLQIVVPLLERRKAPRIAAPTLHHL